MTMEASTVQYEFNDYRRLTRGYLRDYSMWKNAIEAWEKEKADIDKELASVPIAISKYGGEPGGGNGEMNSVECLAERRIKLNERVLTIEQDTRELLRVMKNIKTAIDSLDDETGHIIILHYINKRTWADIADMFAYSESSVKQKGYRAIGKLSSILFGRKAGSFEQVVLIA